MYKTSAAFWGVGAEWQLLPVPSNLSLSCARAVPSPCCCGCSAALASKPGKQNFLCPPKSHCTDTISQELPRFQFYLGLEILNHRKLLKVTEVDSVTGGWADGDWVGNCQTSGGISAPVEKQGHGLLRTCCASATKQFNEAVKWL